VGSSNGQVGKASGKGGDCKRERETVSGYRTILNI
jgi:hypothetical protein